MILLVFLDTSSTSWGEIINDGDIVTVSPPPPRTNKPFFLHSFPKYLPTPVYIKNITSYKHKYDPGKSRSTTFLEICYFQVKMVQNYRDL